MCNILCYYIILYYYAIIYYTLYYTIILIPIYYTYAIMYILGLLRRILQHAPAIVPTHSNEGIRMRKSYMTGTYWSMRRESLCRRGSLITHPIHEYQKSIVIRVN